MALAWVIGAALLPERRIPGWGAPARAVIRVAVGVAATLLWSLALGELGIFSGWLLALLPAGAAALTARPDRALGEPGAASRELLFVGLLVAVVLAISPFKVILGHGDSSYYVFQSISLRDEGSILAHDPLRASLPLDVARQVTQPGGAAWDGLYPARPEDGPTSRTLQWHGLSGFPVLIAAAGVAADDLGLWVVPLLAALQVALLAILTQLIVGGRAGVAAGLAAGSLLAANAGTIYLSRFPLSEPAGGMLLLAGAALMAPAFSRRDVRVAALAGALLGAQLLVRVDAAPLLVVIPAWLVLLTVLGAPLRPAAAAFAAATVMIGWGLVTARLFSSRYADALLGLGVPGGLDGASILAAGAALGAVAIAWAVHRRLRPAPGWLVPAVASVCGLATAAVLVYGYAGEWDLVTWWRWYAKLPVLLALPPAVAIVVHWSLRRELFAVVGVPLLLLAAALYVNRGDIHTTPVHFITARRLAAVAFPVGYLLVAAGAAIVLMRARAGPLRAAIVAGLAVVAAATAVRTVADARPTIEVDGWGGVEGQLRNLGSALDAPRSLVIASGSQSTSVIGPWLHIVRGADVLPVDSTRRLEDAPPDGVYDLDQPPLSAWLRDQVQRRDVRVISDGPVRVGAGLIAEQSDVVPLVLPVDAKELTLPKDWRIYRPTFLIFRLRAAGDG